MKREWMVLFIVGVIAAVILAGCTPAATAIKRDVQESGEQKTAYHKIDAEEAKRMIDEGNVMGVRNMPELGELNQEYQDQGFRIVGMPTTVISVTGGCSG